MARAGGIRISLIGWGLVICFLAGPAQLRAGDFHGSNPVTGSITCESRNQNQDETREALTGSRALAPVIALLPGIFHHGLGASYLGYEQTSRSLVKLEFLGAGLIIAGRIFTSLSKGGGLFYPLYLPLYWAGGLMFIDSYLFGLFGSLNPEGPWFPPDPRISLRSNYTRVKKWDNEVRQIWEGEGEAYFSGFRVELQGAGSGDRYSRVDLQIDRFFPLRKEGRSRIFIGLGGGRERLVEEAGRYESELISWPLMVAGGADFYLGDFSDFFRGIRCRAELGAIWQWIGIDDSVEMEVTVDPLISSRVEWTIHPRVELGIEHSSRTDLLVGQIHRWLGVLGARVRIFPGAGLEVSAGSHLGDGYDVQVGLGYSIK